MEKANAHFHSRWNDFLYGTCTICFFVKKKTTFNSHITIKGRFLKLRVGENIVPESVNKDNNQEKN